MIRRDDFEKLQEISSQGKFDFNQKIAPSLYERFSFINKENVSIIDYAAFFGSIKCFKFLLKNGSNIMNSYKYAVAGGNKEIIKICEQKYAAFNGVCAAAVRFHRNDIFRNIYYKEMQFSTSEIKLKKLRELGLLCLLFNNYEVFSFLEGEGMKINDYHFYEAAKIGNIFLLKYFCEKSQIPEGILVFAAETVNIEVLQFILEQKGIDINARNI